MSVDYACLFPTMLLHHVRGVNFTLDGSGAVTLPVPSLSDWPDVTWRPDVNAKHVNLDTLTPEIVATWTAGDRLLLTGKLLTGRDAAHKRIADLFAKGEGLPAGVDFTNRVIYYVGPVDPVRDEAVAQQLNEVAGKRVTLKYEQHRGLPTSCFGDTDYFVVGVAVIE